MRNDTNPLKVQYPIIVRTAGLFGIGVVITMFLVFPRSKSSRRSSRVRDADGREVQRAAELLRAPPHGRHRVVERFVRRPDLGRVEAVGGQRRGRGGLVVVERRAVEVAVAGVDGGLHARAGLVLRDEVQAKGDLGHGRAIVERERQ